MSEGLLNVVIRCEGVTPLLMNKIPDGVLLTLLDKSNKKAKSAAETRKPRDICADHLHVTKEGVVYLPTGALFACLIEAGKYSRLDGKRQISTGSSTVLPGFLTLSNPTLPLHDPKHPKRKAAEWEVDIRPGRNPNGGELVVLVRPRFDSWGFEAHATIDTSQISEAAIRQLWDTAGMRIGLLDFRPNRKGNCGQFKVVAWERQVSTVAAE